jgi:hypothetical protein
MLFRTQEIKMVVFSANNSVFQILHYWAFDWENFGNHCLWCGQKCDHHFNTVFKVPVENARRGVGVREYWTVVWSPRMEPQDGHPYQCAASWSSKASVRTQVMFPRQSILSKMLPEAIDSITEVSFSDASGG